MIVVGIDPGPVMTAFVEMDDDGEIVSSGYVSNQTMLSNVVAFEQRLSSRLHDVVFDPDMSCDYIAIEMIASYGMAVGAEVFDTCVWIGRYLERSGRFGVQMFRREVKQNLCGDSRAKDSNIRQALIDRWGGSQAIKKGKKKGAKMLTQDGPLARISGDVWAALGVAVTQRDKILGKVAA